MISFKTGEGARLYVPVGGEFVWGGTRFRAVPLSDAMATAPRDRGTFQCNYCWLQRFPVSNPENDDWKLEICKALVCRGFRYDNTDVVFEKAGE
jgi:hypothetical protein